MAYTWQGWDSNLYLWDIHPSLCTTTYVTVHHCDTPPPIKYGAKSLIFKLQLNIHIQECLLSHKGPLTLCRCPWNPILSDAEQGGKKSKLGSQGNKRLLSPAPGFFKPKHSAHSYISLQILGGPTCSRLYQRLLSLPCTRHSVPRV